jgi:hypothetical protein
MTSYLYRLEIDAPPEWALRLPDEVQDAVDKLPAPYQRDFATRGSAYARRKFWRRMGAQAEVLRSDPVTWPERADSSEKEQVA